MCDAAELLPLLPFALDPRLERYQGTVIREEHETTPVQLGSAIGLLNNCAMQLTQAADPAKAWSCLFDKEDIVGIKVNCRAGRTANTNPVLAEAVARCLIGMGIRPDHIIIWDRRNADLHACGFQLNTLPGAIRCIGIEDVFDEELTECGAVAGQFTRLLTRTCTALVSLPVLREHPLEGIDGCVHNLYGAMKNPWKYNATAGCALNVDLLGCAPIRAKWRLGVCDAVQEKEILFAADPVAIDAASFRMLKDGKDGALLPEWLCLAESAGFGMIG